MHFRKQNSLEVFHLKNETQKKNRYLLLFVEKVKNQSFRYRLVWFGLVFSLIVYAGTKPTPHRSPPMAHAPLATRALTAEDFTRRFVLTRIGTNETHSFTPPPQVPIYPDWRTFGAAEDWFSLNTDKWSFPLGTNDVMRFRISSFGKIAPFVGTLSTNVWFSPFQTVLGIVPEAQWGHLENATQSCFWHAFTPSNTLQLTWHNALFNRSVHTPVSFQTELFPDGRFIFHTDLSHLGEENVSNILVGASLGTGAWSTHMLASNRTSLAFAPLSPEDAENPDRDGDGLSTVDELFRFFTDPGKVDSDGDGLEDPAELASGTDPRNLDTDGDGLRDGEEHQLGTNPLMVDTDGDGLSDWDEFKKYHTSPVHADTDSDGLSDAQELDRLILLPSNSWVEVSQVTSLFKAPMDGSLNDAIGTIHLPFLLMCEGITFDRLSVDVNGKIHLIARTGTPITSSSYTPDVEHLTPQVKELLIAPFWTDLVLRAALGSQIGVGTDASNSCVVIHYERMGCVNASNTNDFLTCQVVLPADTNTPIQINYQEVPANQTNVTIGVIHRRDVSFKNRRCARALLWDAKRDEVVQKGLSIGFHFGTGTDPCRMDTDGDGLRDGDEVERGTDPLHPDTDRDGLEDGAEVASRASPFSSDTDGDGLPDGWEVNAHLNPCSAEGASGSTGDPDEDGLTNAEEYALGTHPYVNDTDGDGLDDGEEVGCMRTRRAHTNEWASVETGWTRQEVETSDEGCGVYFVFDDSLKIGNEWIEEMLCQENGLILIGTTEHPIEEAVLTEPVDLAGDAVSSAALVLAPFWTERLTMREMCAIQVFSCQNAHARRYAIQYCDFPVGETQTVSFQVTLVLTNGVYQATEMVSENDTSIEVRNASVSRGVQDAVHEKKMSLSFGSSVVLNTNRVQQFIPGTGTSPLSAIQDRDGDGLTDDFERRLGTNPNEPDTDGDGLHDGWEYRQGFDPCVNNDDPDVDTDPMNDSTADADNDGLMNQEEADWGTNPHVRDSDGDGVWDGDEVLGGSDPNDATDDGCVVNRQRIHFYFGDPSESHSEKYRLQVKPVKDPYGQAPQAGEEPKTFEWLNAKYGECETKTAMLLPGWTYDVRLFHAGTNKAGGVPDYDYTVMCRPSSWVGVVTNDPQRLFGASSNDGETFEAAGKVAHILVLDGGLVGDFDRRNGLTREDLVHVSQNQPLRHWINDDEDEGDICADEGDLPGSAEDGKPNYSNRSVDGRRDILDFTPVWINMGRALAQLAREKIDVELTLAHADEAVNVVWTSLTTNAVETFLTTEISGCGETLSQPLARADVTPITKDEILLPTAFVQTMKEDARKGVILLEGRAVENKRLSTAPLVLRVYRKPFEENKAPLFTLSLPLSISPVEDMYRWIDERGVCGDRNHVTSRWDAPANNPDHASDGRHFIFVHGYNVNAPKARAWASEMFKRMYQSGACAMFTAVDWYGNDSEIPGWIPKYGNEAPNYYANVEHAFQTAQQFAQDCASLPGRKILLAHSLGNVLVSSAIKDHGLSDYAKYYMLNAAVPMEAYDKDESAQALVDSDWRESPATLYAANWFRQFDETDGRSKLAWRERFGGIARAVNCYSSTEDVLGNVGYDEWKIAMWWKNKYWAMQEMNKGSALARLAPEAWMHCEGGWGFNPYHTERWYAIGPIRLFLSQFNKEISSLTREELMCHPVFRPFDEDWLFTTNHIPVSRVESVRAKILADGIPATSFAAGANPMGESIVAGNIDYGTCMSGKWPRKDGRWLHSDIKNVAFIFIHKFFMKLANGESQ